MESSGFEKRITGMNADIEPGNIRILIAEDDLSSEPLWSYIVSRATHGGTYDWVTSAEAAEEKIRSSKIPYDLVITDLYLSGARTGLDLWKDYAKLLEGRLILISSLEYLKVAEHVGNLTETPLYLQKPLILHECIEVLYGLLYSNLSST